MSETEIILKILNNDNKIDTIFIDKLNKAKNILKKKKILNMTIKKLSIDDFTKYKKISNINNLFSFECSNIKLDRVPIMMNVEILKVPNCRLVSMAHFYNNLKELNCAFNYLYFLPEIPKSKESPLLISIFDERLTPCVFCKLSTPENILELQYFCWMLGMRENKPRLIFNLRSPNFCMPIFV